MTHGPLMFDLSGTTLTNEEREMIQHPAAGGIILFTRNYESPGQITALINQIHQAREPQLLVAVDQEGGRVQRFQQGFTRLPPAAWFGQLYNTDPQNARTVTELVGWLMAKELRSVGVDFSFAPVLDLDRKVSQVIGDRAFHTQPEIVSKLAISWMKGAREAGMASVGKHFPGHGSVCEDSHLALPVDKRRPEDIMMEDLMPFEQLINNGLEAIMPAHVIYEKASPELAGFSGFWLRDILRKRLGFQGVIFSDDLTMAAACEAGRYPDRARVALDAGCDMVLVCNNPDGAAEVLDSLSDYANPASQMRLVRMHGRNRVTAEQVREDKRYRQALDAIIEYERDQSLNLDLN